MPAYDGVEQLPLRAEVLVERAGATGQAAGDLDVGDRRRTVPLPREESGGRIERYAEVDDKIRPVSKVRRTTDSTVFTCRPKLAGLRMPGPKVTQRIDLTAGERVDISVVPSIWTKLSEFHASFVCTPTDEGTVVDRTLEFRFSPVVRWALQPLFRRRLPAEVRDELLLAKDHLEHTTAATAG